MTTKNKIKLLDTKPRKMFFVHAGFNTSFTYLTSGVFLSGLAIWMGAGDVISSYLSVIINVCGILILAFTAFLERFQSRKRMTIILTILSRVATMFIVVIPLMFPAGVARLAVFVTAVVVAFTLQAQTTVMLNQWMLGFIDEKRKGRYISIRQTLTMIVTVALSISGGYWMDYMKGGYSGGEYLGIAILFAVAGVMGVCEVLILSRTPDSLAVKSTERKSRIRDMILIPFKNRKFINFMIYIICFYLILYIGDSFFMVYMLRYLELPYSTVTMLCLIMTVPQIFLLGIWGKINDKYGAKFSLKMSIWMFIGETFFMFFASPQNWYIFIPLAYSMSSIANAGFSVAVFNRRYELMPKENRIVYDNFFTAGVGVGFIVGPLIGSLFKSIFEANTAISTAMPLANIRLLFLISTIGLIILQTVNLLVSRKISKKDAAIENLQTCEDISPEPMEDEDINKQALIDKNDVLQL